MMFEGERRIARGEGGLMKENVIFVAPNLSILTSTLTRGIGLDLVGNERGICIGMELGSSWFVVGY